VSSSALLGGFAIGARVSLRWQHSAAPNAKCQRLLVLALCLVILFVALSASYLQNICHVVRRNHIIVLLCGIAVMFMLRQAWRTP